MEYKFKTIAKSSEGIFKDRGSKFIAQAHPISNEKEFKMYLAQSKEKYSDAGHHCYGFCIGLKQEQYRYSDDGEPAGTAGKPIHGQILSHELTNICIIVVRYFGGTKLGVSGLINAYKMAAIDALENNTIIEKELMCQFEINYKYTDTSYIERTLKNVEGEFNEQIFEEKCFAIISLPLKNKMQFTEQFSAFNPKELS